MSTVRAVAGGPDDRAPAAPTWDRPPRGWNAALLVLLLVSFESASHPGGGGFLLVIAALVIAVMSLIWSVQGLAW